MPQTLMTTAIPSRDTDLIWHEFSNRLRAFIVRRVRSEADAEDILQDVFLRIHQHAGSVDRADRLTSWLFQVTRNAIIDYYRSPMRREQPEGVMAQSTLAQAVSATRSVDLELEPGEVREELAGCLRPMIERLPPLYREAVGVVDLTGLTQVQAAARLGLSVSGMKSRVQRGRRALKDMLVDCCPVQLDAGGRILDYDRPGPRCTKCADAAETATLSDDRAGHGRCCGPSTVMIGE